MSNTNTGATTIAGRITGNGFDFTSQQTVAGSGNSDLGKDAFLKILMLQLSNQDPLNPMSDTEFIAQMAQFTALEQMQQMNTQVGTQRAEALIGKEVLATQVLGSNGYPQNVPDGIYGQVAGVLKVNGENYLQVGEFLVPFSSVIATYGPTIVVEPGGEEDPNKPEDPEKPVDPDKPEEPEKPGEGGQTGDPSENQGVEDSKDAEKAALAAYYQTMFRVG